MTLENLRRGDFDPLVSSEFMVTNADGAADRLRLIEVSDLAADRGRDPQGVRRPFSLLFRGPNDLLLTQGVHRLDHPALGVLDVFLVPMQPDAEGRLFEAVFA